MSEFTALRISRSNPSTVAAAGDRYWLRIVQDQGDDRLTPADAADLVDALYDLDPCLAPATAETVEAEPVTEEKLYRKAAEVFGSDLASCRAALSGEYTETVKIIRSHPREKPPQPYQLQLSAGEVVGIRTVQEYISAAIDVSGTTSIDLEYPVVLDKDTPEEMQKVKLSWQGDVIGAAGLITPPELSRTNNTIYWDERATGTIRAEYPTEYDEATIRVPGVPLVQGSEVGSSQDIKILAYWHLMVFPGEIKKPVEDNTVSKGDMRLLCGYVPDSPWAAAGVAKSLAAQTASDEAAGDPANDPDSPQYGCQDWSSYYSQEATYRQICCHDPNSPPYACTLRTERRPGGASISEADVKKYTKKQPAGSAIVPVTEFIPVSPDDPDGCGTITWRLWTGHRICCDAIAPIEPDPNNQTEVGHGGGITITVIGGDAILHWSVVGGTFADGSTAIDTTLRSLLVLAGECQNLQIRINDDCTDLVIHIPIIGAVPLSIPAEDRVVAPGGQILIVTAGGSPPFVWQASNLTHLGGGLFQAPENFCGTARVTVHDACGASATCAVRSTDGLWVDITADIVAAGSYCTGVDSSGASAFFNGIWRTDTQGVTDGLFVWTTMYIGKVLAHDFEGVCPGNDLGALLPACRTLWLDPNAYLSSGACCHIQSNGQEYCYDVGEQITQVKEWRCNE